jgi:hypothetical protein
MHARQRQPPTVAAGGAQHVDVGAAVIALPSGLLALVGEALVAIESQLEARPLLGVPRPRSLRRLATSRAMMLGKHARLIPPDTHDTWCTTYNAACGMSSLDDRAASQSVSFARSCMPTARCGSASPMCARCSRRVRVMLRTLCSHETLQRIDRPF